MTFNLNFSHILYLINIKNTLYKKKFYYYNKKL